MVGRSRAGSTCVICSTSPARGQALPPINTADTDHDFAVFISNRPCGDKVTELAKKVRRPSRALLDPGQPARRPSGTACSTSPHTVNWSRITRARTRRTPRRSSNGLPTG